MFTEYQGIINNNFSTDYSEVQLGSFEEGLLVIAISEHILIVLIYILKIIIPTTPLWIIEENETILKLLNEDIK